MREVIDWAVIVGLGLVILMNVSCGDSDHPTPPSNGTTVKTAKGATLLHLSGPVPDGELMNAVDAQISRVTEIAAKKGYAFPAHDRYVIELVEPSADCGGGFRTPGGQYGSTICVAGQYFPSTRRIRTTTAAILHMNAVHYEGEHYGLHLTDQAEYLRTLSHPPPHPIFGEE
jgi:hypothetical protein